MYQHSKAPFYQEVRDCIKRLRKKYHIILSSDSNHLMVDDLIRNVDYDEAFISDDLQSYKGDKHGRFFNAVLCRLHVDPGEVLHIGDSTADILGAHQAGIASCWINRENREWHHTTGPDYRVRNFNELEELL